MIPDPDRSGDQFIGLLRGSEFKRFLFGNINRTYIKDLIFDVGSIDVAEEKTLELTASQQTDELIAGSIRIWYHSGNWNTMEPVDFPFTVYPESAAGVSDNTTGIASLSLSPNPSMGRTNIHFTMPEQGNISLRIYDALGRLVKTVSNGLSEGEKNIQLTTKGMSPGEYT